MMHGRNLVIRADKESPGIRDEQEILLKTFIAAAVVGLTLTAGNASAQWARTYVIPGGSPQVYIAPQNNYAQPNYGYNTYRPSYQPNYATPYQSNYGNRYQSNYGNPYQSNYGSQYSNPAVRIGNTTISSTPFGGTYIGNGRFGYSTGSAFSPGGFIIGGR